MDALTCHACEVTDPNVGPCHRCDLDVCPAHCKVTRFRVNLCFPCYDEYVANGRSSTFAANGRIRVRKAKPSGFVVKHPMIHQDCQRSVEMMTRCKCDQPVVWASARFRCDYQGDASPASIKTSHAAYRVDRIMRMRSGHYEAYFQHGTLLIRHAMVMTNVEHTADAGWPAMAISHVSTLLHDKVTIVVATGPQRILTDIGEVTFMVWAIPLPYMEEHGA